MDCARDPERAGDIQQKSRCILFRDGHDRGTFRIGYLYRPLAHYLAIPQVFTGTVPFNNNPPATVVLAIINGKRPSRPIRSDFTDELWTLMQHCWDQNLHLRPEISEVLKVLSGS